MNGGCLKVLGKLCFINSSLPVGTVGPTNLLLALCGLETVSASGVSFGCQLSPLCFRNESQDNSLLVILHPDRCIYSSKKTFLEHLLYAIL